MKKNLTDDAKYPLRESTSDGLKPHCWDYYDNYDRSKYRTAYTICYGIIEKYLNKDFAIALNKLRNHIKYRKCHVFKKVANGIIYDINHHDKLFLHYYRREYAIVDGLLKDCSSIIEGNIKKSLKKYEILFKFIKFDGLNHGYYIYKDIFYYGHLKYPDRCFDDKFTQVRKLTHDEVLDLKDQMKSLHL